MIITDYFKNKKEKKIFEAELKANGFALESIDYSGSALMGSRLFLCLIRGILIFFACFGTVGAAVSSFGLRYNVPFVAISILLISMFVAFIYYNSVTFYLGYILFFIGFAATIALKYWYVNSGFQAFVNTLNQEYSLYFYLNSAREASEAITDRYTTVSVAMIFVAAFLSLLLNITISGYMNLVETFILTFPIVQIGLYIERRPSLIYIIMLLSVYISVAVLGRSGHYMTPAITGKKKNFRTFRSEKKKTRIHTHSYISDGLGMITTGAWSIVFCIVFIMLTSGIFYSNTDARHESNLLKNTTDEYIKAFVENGIYSFFDRYQSKGGLSQGQLGGVSSVRPDYTTDLIVTFNPTNTDSLYLRAYIGTSYDNNVFSTSPYQLYDYNSAGIRPDMYSFPDHNPILGGPTGKMNIINVDADATYDYMPYYTESASSRSINEDGKPVIDVLYEPFESSNTYMTDNPPSDDYKTFVYSTYLDIPPYLDETMKTISDEAGIDKYMSVIHVETDPEKRQAYFLAAADDLRRYFYENYSYTMAPGVTPYRQDFINYFLNEQRRGYCAHFAASSALILRSIGIPTRYVEGYMITFTNVIESEALPGKSTDLLSDGLTPVFDNIQGVKVEVTDGSAHAWTEIYLDGYGWIPFDFTPPSADNVILTDYSFGSLFAGLFMTRDDSQQSETTGDTNANTRPVFSGFKFSINGSFGFILLPLIFVLTGTVILLIMHTYFPVILSSIKISAAVKKGDYNNALNIRYILFQKKVMKHYKLSAPLTPIEMYEFLKERPVSDDDTQNTMRICGQAIFSPQQISKDDYDICIKTIKQIEKKIGSDK